MNKKLSIASKDEKKARISRFIEELPNKMIKKMRKIENLQEEIEEDRDYECPFAPALCNKSRDIVDRRRLRKIYDRYEDEHKEKERRLNLERIEKERREMELYQSMQIHRPSNRKYSSSKRSNRSRSRRNSVSKNYTTTKNKRRSRRVSLRNSYSFMNRGDQFESPRKSIYDTQKEWLDRRNEKILRMQMDNADRELMEGEEYNFIPKINRRSSSRIKMDFFERQQMYKKKKEKNIEKLNRSVDSYSFQPRINSNSTQLIKTALKRKLFLASQVKELDPKIGYHAMRTYVTDHKKSRKHSRHSHQHDHKKSQKKFKNKFNSVMAKHRSSSGAVLQRQKSQNLIMDKAIDDALKGYNSQA